MREILYAAKVLKNGGIVAYPTEAVFGLGCDLFNPNALSKLLQLKNRTSQKGLILISDCFEKFRPFIAEVPEEKLALACATWPGPYTWVFPANIEFVPEMVRGAHQTVAIRVTNHPIARALCEAFGDTPLVSTSANLSSQSPLISAKSVEAFFGKKLDYVLQGETAGLLTPTRICDVLTGRILR
jgi:L-threonylcarbamoyladenylate synthase